MDSIVLNNKDFVPNVLRTTLTHFAGYQVRIVTRSNIIFEGTYVNMNTKNQICLKDAYQVDNHNPLEQGIRVNTLMISVSTLRSIQPTTHSLYLDRRLYGVRFTWSPPLSFDRKEKKNDVTKNNNWYDEKSQQNDTSQHTEATLPTPENFFQNDLVLDHLSPTTWLQVHSKDQVEYIEKPEPQLTAAGTESFNSFHPNNSEPMFSHPPPSVQSNQYQSQQTVPLPTQNYKNMYMPQNQFPNAGFSVPPPTYNPNMVMPPNLNAWPFQNYGRNTHAPTPPHAPNVYNADTSVPSYFYGLPQSNMAPNFITPNLSMPAPTNTFQNMQQRPQTPYTPMHDSSNDVDPYILSLLYHYNNQMAKFSAAKNMQYGSYKPAYEPPQPQMQPQQQGYYTTQETSAQHAGHAAVAGIATGFRSDYTANSGHTQSMNNDKPLFENKRMFKSPAEASNPEWLKLRQIWANKNIEDYRMAYNAKTYEMVNAQNFVATEDNVLGAAAGPQQINQNMPVNKPEEMDIKDYENILTGEFKNLNL